MDTIGFDGQITMPSAPAMASRTPGAAAAVSTPASRMARTGTSWRRPTKYSWNPTSWSRPSASTTTTRVSTRSSDMGRIRTATPQRAAISAVTSDRVAPSSSRVVRYRWVPRSRSPRLNQPSRPPL